MNSVENLYQIEQNQFFIYKPVAKCSNCHKRFFIIIDLKFLTVIFNFQCHRVLSIIFFVQKFIRLIKTKTVIKNVNLNYE